MKNLKVVIVALAVLLGAGTTSAQVVEEGTILIDAYSGYPDLYRAVIKSAYKNSGSTNDGIKIGGAGPFGGRFEYLVADKIGIGVDVNYTNAFVSYSEDTFDTSLVATTYDYKISVPRTRAMAAINFHFGNSDTFDGYFKVGAGLNASKFKVTTDDPDFTDDDISLTNLIPVAFRLGVGGRYFFTDAIGINFEIGLGGGPLMAYGLSFKL